MPKRKPDSVRGGSRQVFRQTLFNAVHCLIVKPKLYEGMNFKVPSQTQNVPGYWLTKTFRVMKLTAILLLGACLHVSAKVFSQEKISLHEKDASLQKIFEDIQKQTHFIFWCEEWLLKKGGTVTLDIQDATL